MNEKLERKIRTEQELKKPREIGGDHKGKNESYSG